ncbi:MarR family winged helix-turn-helix transcriptional regulator [Catelliglobosispora koreensis]|uniref:MarR family winged helix-turn-helix transcriptional regulator n=1 Tax=Catelliglobosispora koreensis TaxID=129052 RepID=UPI0003704639|nr:MarR family transcriptional regulator [Catelliglobosispora koreensis]
MLEGPEQSPGFQLWHVTLRWQREMARVLTPFDLTHVQFVLLACLWWLDSQGHQPNQLELAQQAGTDVKMTSQVLGRLEAKGLLNRVADTVDTRMKRLQITKSGKRVAVAAIEVVEQADAAFFGDSKALLKALRPLLPSLYS